MTAKYLIRLDDISENMDWEKFYSLIDIFKRFNIRPLLGIIPNNQDPELLKYKIKNDFWKIVFGLKQEGYSIAQHGYNHLYCNSDPGILKFPSKSEFAGISYEGQCDKIAKGKKILENNGLITDIFMAPSHSFDFNTILALKKNGFRYITDGIGLFPFRLAEIFLIPVQIHVPRYFPFGYITLCIHPNSIDRNFLNKLEEFIKNNKDNIIDFDLMKNIIEQNSKIFSYWKRSINSLFKINYYIVQKIKGIY